MSPFDLIVKVCQGIDPNSWEWWRKGCWMFSSGMALEALSMGLSVVAAMLSASLVRWFVGRSAA